MNNKPGVNTFLDSEQAKGYLPLAFSLLEEHLRSKPEHLEIDRFTRIVDGAIITGIIHHGQASLHIDTGEKKEQRDRLVLEEKGERKRRRREVEYDFLRLYAHVDIITNADDIGAPAWNDAGGPVNLSSALACGIYDVGSGELFDKHSAPLSQRIFSGTWGSTSQPIGITPYANHPDWYISDAVNIYESLLPSMYGAGVTTLNDSTPLFIAIEECSNQTDPRAFAEPSLPYLLSEVYREGSDADPYTDTITGCCVSLYHSDSLWKANDYKKIRVSDSVYGCDQITVYRGANLNTWAFYSRGYGQIFNGAVERRVDDDPVMFLTGCVGVGYLDDYQCPRINDITGYRDYVYPPLYQFRRSANFLNFSGMNVSFRLNDGVCAYGESVQANIYRPNDRTARGIINLNATIGRNLTPFEPELWTLTETASATAAFKELYELAVITAGGFVTDPMTATADLATQQLTVWNNEVVDIRSLPGTSYGSPISNVKLYAAPIRVKRIIEE